MKRFVCSVVLAFSVSAVFAGGAAESSKASTTKTIEGKLTVAAAANLSALGAPLKEAFIARYPGIAMDIVYGSSGKLTAQIKNGAPFQIFLSADVGFPAQLNAEGFAAGPEKVYATGTLILLSAEPRDFSEGLRLLESPAVERFAIANPETAPYGRASVEAMTAAGVWENVKAKAVTAQSISQAVQYALTAAGLGFVNKSALYTKDLADFADKEGVNWIGVDPKSHAPIDQAFIVLKSAANDPAAAAFADFLSSQAARGLFLRFGYAVP